MPTSDRQGKFISKALINAANPSTIWDIGPGEGTYYDLLEGNQPSNEWFSGNFYQWVAVEVWPPYIHEYNLRDKYDIVYDEDVRDVGFPEDRSFLNEDLII